MDLKTCIVTREHEGSDHLSLKGILTGAYIDTIGSVIVSKSDHAIVAFCVGILQSLTYHSIHVAFVHGQGPVIAYY